MPPTPSFFHPNYSPPTKKFTEGSFFNPPDEDAMLYIWIPAACAGIHRNSKTSESKLTIAENYDYP